MKGKSERVAFLGSVKAMWVGSQAFFFKSSIGKYGLGTAVRPHKLLILMMEVI